MSTTDVQQPGIENHEEVQIKKLVWVGPLAATMAMLANVLLYYFVTRILQIQLVGPEQFPPPEVSPIPVTDIVIFTLIFAVGAVIVFGFVNRLSQMPIRTYLIVSFTVLILSMFLPLKIPTPPVPMSTKWSLVMLHLIGYVFIVGVLLSLCREKQQAINGSGI